MDFNQSPFLVIWETTRACALRCLHCRAEAIDRRDPGELTEQEAFALLDEVRRFGSPLMVLTGGDPMRRPDIFRIVEYGTRIGLRMTATPSATSEMTAQKVRALKEAGLARLAVSLDGSTAAIHDAFRRVEGSFGWTLDIVRWAGEAGLPVQINTTMMRHNRDDFDSLARLMRRLDIVLWSVFFLVPVGRGQREDELSGPECEGLFNKMADLARTAPFGIKSTEAPNYRRVVLQRGRRPDGARVVRDVANPSGDPPDGIRRPAIGVNDGKGFVFVSYTGQIHPSGFLPIPAGNVRRDRLTEIYRYSPLFRSLREPSAFKGKCGVCEYRNVCGGSRSRAYAYTGDPLGSDPSCVHVPAACAQQSGAGI